MGPTANRFNLLSPEAKLIAGFGLAFAVLIAVGLVQYRSIQDLIETDGWVLHSHTVMAELEAVYSGLQQAESGTRGYVATGQQDYFQQQESGIADARDHFRSVQTLIADNPQQERNLDRLALLNERKTAVMQNLVALRRDQGFAEASQHLSDEEGLRLMREVRAQVDLMKAAESALLRVRQAASRRRARVADALTALGTLLAVAFVLAAAGIGRRDARQRQLAQQALQAANAYNRSLLEASLDPLVTISPGGKITDVNSAAEKITGVARQELIGTDFSDYFTDPQKARASYQQVFREGFVQDYELEVRHRNGHLRPVLYNASLYRDEAGQVMGVFAAARDITQRKRAEEALQRASAYNRSLLEASLDPLVTIRPDGKITDVNTAAENITGMATARADRNGFLRLLHRPAKSPRRLPAGVPGGVGAGL